MKISAKELDRVLQNALEFGNEGEVRLNEILFVFSTDNLSVLSCDDYVAVVDRVDGDFYENTFSLTIPDAKRLGAWIKTDRKTVKKVDIEVRYKMTGIIFEVEDDSFFVSWRGPKMEGWNLVFQLLEEDHPDVMFDGFAIRPERLTKMSKLRADKEAPIDLRAIDINGHLIVQFRLGHTLRGAIRPVDTDYVQEEFLWHHTDQSPNF